MYLMVVVYFMLFVWYVCILIKVCNEWYLMILKLNDYLCLVIYLMGFLYMYFWLSYDVNYYDC